MNKSILTKFSALLGLALVLFTGCKEEEYTLGALSSPENLIITTEVVGQNDANPYGDGSGLVKISATADNAMTYRIGYTEVADLNASPTLEAMPKGSVNKKFSKLGNVTYRITVVAYGAGGASTVATKDITVKSVFNPDPTIVANLTGGSSKTWKVDASVPGHMGVGPYNKETWTPEWWSAAINEKAACCNCFYTASFTFTQVNPTTFTINSTTPDGALSKTGTLSGIPGMPASGEEGCYPYAGGTGAFSFIEASAGLPADVTTSTSILLADNSTFIGYGATKKEYEILEITSDYMYLRVQGTETGNAWYLKLIPVQ